jgi:hypothetical protein
MVAPSLHNRHYAYRHSKRTHEQDGLLVVATPAYQTAYQSVRPGPTRRYSGGRSLRSAQLSNAGGSWLTRKRSLVQIQYRPLVTPLVKG